MSRISELTADQLARHATNVSVLVGRHLVGARLIYRALELDPYQPEALRRLVDFLDNDGTEPLAASVFEYALAPDSPIPPAGKEALDNARFLAIWAWNYSRHRTGMTLLGWQDFEDRTQFVVDETGYRAFVGQAVDEAGSLPGAFRAAHTLVGVLGKLLTHRTLGISAPLEEVFHLERFMYTPEYTAWLDSDTGELDDLELSRQEMESEQ